MPQNRLLYQVGIDSSQARAGGKAAADALRGVESRAQTASASVSSFGNRMDGAAREARQAAGLVNQYGNAVRQAAAAGNQVSSVVDAQGRAFTQAARNAGQAARLVDQYGDTIRRVSNVQTRPLTDQGRAFGRVRDEAGRAQPILDQYGNAAREIARSSGAVANLVDAQGRALGRAANEAGRSANLVDQYGNSANQASSRIQRLTQGIEAQGRAFGRTARVLSRQASGAFGSIAEQSQRAVGSLVSRTSQLTSSLRGLSQASAQAGAATSQVANQAAQASGQVAQLGQAVEAQGRAINQSARESARASNLVDQYGRSINNAATQSQRVVNLVDAQGQAFSRASRGAAQAATLVDRYGQAVGRAAQNSQRVVNLVNAQGQAFNRAGTEANQAAQLVNQYGQSFDRATRQLTVAQEQYRQSVADSAAAQQQTTRGTAEATGLVDRYGRAIGRTAGQLDRYGTATQRARQSIQVVNNISKEATRSFDSTANAAQRTATVFGPLGRSVGRANTEMSRAAIAARELATAYNRANAQLGQAAGVANAAAAAAAGQAAASRAAATAKRAEAAASKEASAQGEKHEATTKSVERSTKRTTAATRNWAQTLRIVAVQLAAATAFRFAPELVRSFINFEHQLRVIEGLVGINRETLNSWRGEILAIGAISGQGLRDLGDALFFITSAGIRGSAALDILEQSAIASAAGLGEQAEIVDLVTAAVNAYGQASLSAAEATDILTRAVELGRLAPDALAKAAGRALPIASRLGVTLDEVLGLLAAMSRTGTTAEEGVTQLSQVMATLLKPTQEAEEALARIGNTAEGLGLTFDTLRDIANEQGLFRVLETLAAAVDDLDDLANIFPNIRALRGVFDLLGENYLSNARLLDQIADNAGKTQQAFEAVERTLRQRWRTFISTFIAGLADVGRTAEQNIGNAVEFITERIEILTTATRILIYVLGALAGAALAAAIKGLVAGIAALTISTGPLGLLLAGLAVVAGVAATHFLVFRDATDEAADSLENLEQKYGLATKAANELTEATDQAAQSARERLRSELEVDLQAAQQNIDDFRRRTVELRAQIADLQKQAEAAPKDIQFPIRIHGVEAELHRVQDQLVRAFRARHDIEVRLSGQREATQALEDMTAALDDIQMRLGNLSESGVNVSPLSAQLEALRQELENATTPTDELRDRIVALSLALIRLENPLEVVQPWADRFEEAADEANVLLRATNLLAVATNALGRTGVDGFEAITAASDAYLGNLQDMLTGSIEHDRQIADMVISISEANEHLEDYASIWDTIVMVSLEHDRFLKSSRNSLSELGSTTVDYLSEHRDRADALVGAIQLQAGAIRRLEEATAAFAEANRGGDAAAERQIRERLQAIGEARLLLANLILRLESIEREAVAEQLDGGAGFVTVRVDPILGNLSPFTTDIGEILRRLQGEFTQEFRIDTDGIIDVDELERQGERAARTLEKLMRDMQREAERAMRRTRQVIAREMMRIVDIITDSTSTASDLLRALARAILNIGVQLLDNRLRTGSFLPGPLLGDQAPAAGGRGTFAYSQAAPVSVNVRNTYQIDSTDGPGVAAALAAAEPGIRRRTEAGIVAGLQQHSPLRNAVRLAAQRRA